MKATCSSDIASKLRSVQCGDIVHYYEEEKDKSALGVVAGWRLNLKTGKHQVLIEGGNFTIPLESVYSRVREYGPGKGEVQFHEYV